jgi:hypothetical protein
MAIIISQYKILMAMVSVSTPTTAATSPFELSADQQKRWAPRSNVKGARVSDCRGAARSYFPLHAKRGLIIRDKYRIFAVFGGAVMDQGKSSHTGICALCKQTRILQNSHLMPKWAYKRLQQTPLGREDPIRVSDGSALYTSEQVTRHLLCEDCENRFSQREDYVAEITKIDANGNLKILQGIKRLNAPERFLIELGNSIDAEKLAYFSASIIWRAGAMGLDCRLGSYEPEFRGYLLGNADFPASAAVGMALLESSLLTANPENWVSLPSSVHAYPVWIHGFIVCGLAFRCHVGRALDPKMKHVCLVRANPKKYAALLPADKLGDFRAVFDKLVSAIPRGKLAGKP